MATSGDNLSQHLPPIPLFNRKVTGPRDGSVNCECGTWPAPRRVGDRRRLCESCYQQERERAQSSASSPSDTS